MEVCEGLAGLGGKRGRKSTMIEEITLRKIMNIIFLNVISDRLSLRDSGYRFVPLGNRQGSAVVCASDTTMLRVVGVSVSEQGESALSAVRRRLRVNNKS